MDAAVGRVVSQQIARLARDKRIYIGTNVDEDAWLRLLIERMETDEPAAHRSVQLEAARDYYMGCIKHYIRGTRDTAMDAVRDVRDSMKRATEQNTIVKFKVGKEFKVKRYIDITPREALALSEECRKQGGALLRKAAQYEADANRAIQLGLALDRPFSTMFKAEDLEGSFEDEAA